MKDKNRAMTSSFLPPILKYDVIFRDGVLNRLGIGMGDDGGVGDEENVNYDNYGVNVRSLTRIYNYGGSSYLS